MDVHIKTRVLNFMIILIQILILLLPQAVKKYILARLYGFTFENGTSIGMSLILCKEVKMYKNSRIGHFNMIKGLDQLCLEESATICNLNWITAFPSGTDSLHFAHQKERKAIFQLGRHSAITSRHLIDCTGGFYVGEFSTFAGYRSQVLTHSIDLRNCRQSATSVKIGNYCFIGTNCVFLPGAVIPNLSVVAASSAITSELKGELGLFAGVPAKRIKELKEDEFLYMSRLNGFVY